MHSKLELIQGIPKPALYTGTDDYNPGIEELINLISGEQGFAADLDGWQPQIAQPKAGVWSETAISTGRQLVQQEDQNVIETLTIQLTASTAQDFAVKTRRFHRLMENARDFHQTNYQISPVYLCHQFTGEVGPRYALIYTMQVAQDIPVEPNFNRELTVTIEREAYWRPIPPGSNPKIWTFESQGLTPGTGPNHYDSDDLSLTDGSDHIASATITNQRSWSESGGVYTELTQNYVDIPAEKIPGDAPALMLISMKENEAVGGVNHFALMYVAADSQPQQATNSAGDPIYRVLNFYVDRGTYPYPPVDKNVNRGRFSVLLRANANGTNAYVRIGDAETDPRVLVSPGGSSGDGFIYYMGVVNVPDRADGRAQANGTGLAVRADNSDESLTKSLVNIGIGGQVDEPDIMLMPIEQGQALLPSAVNSDWDDEFQAVMVLDGTNYFTVGYPEDFAAFIRSSVFEGQIEPQELRGQAPYLIPGVDNRVYFSWLQDGITTTQLNPDSQIQVRINIIPRWRGMRDV